ncbi:zinc-binding alcohol dehydrogenase family protein [Actinokineospora bangkokensis]|uniref:Zinc-type alcohol dehydrogenase-like protein n=1 Tax=Actinokineospora bangkokensis TaxID=1193682 RepID=A0A1Q9LKW6_9PSEU|nr:zinc-binding alcohol dehydrogenase family protein [Actinokineospora bangkokensis]OLR92660.1 NADPH:quinone reductase [Actinokineospora bangkokensis]
MSTPNTTRAVAALRPGTVDDPDSFVEVDLDLPAPGPHDLLVEVRAVSVNPADHKVRSSFDGDAPKVLGYDAAGVVVAAGERVGAFAVGDEVYYAGSIARPGTNARLHLVDERIVGHKPATLDFAEAAALPLTAITAWETLFDRMRLTADSTGTLLVVAGAGGVGSMVIQLARALTGVTVVATASRPESRRWALDLGAHSVVDHRELRSAVSGVDWVFSPFSAGNVETFAQIMGVGGQVVAIDEPEGLDTLPLKAKSQTWTWELMFTRPLHDPESTAQRELLDEVARLVDAGTLRTTLTQRLGPISPDTLRAAHRAVEGSGMVGKVVVEGW